MITLHHQALLLASCCALRGPAAGAQTGASVRADPTVAAVSEDAVQDAAARLAERPAGVAEPAGADARPNIVLVLADDFGWGDLHALNESSELPTPALDRLASEGLLYSDAHSPSAVCTPTRYGLLTGRYAWRTRLQHGVLGGYSKPLIEPERRTIAERLAARGYRTAMVGKWHLGVQLSLLEGAGDLELWPGDPGVDFEGPILDGPLQHGFDSFFGVTGSLDMPPYVWVRDDHFSGTASHQQAGVAFPHYLRPGPRAEDFVHERALQRLFDEAVGVIADLAEREAPLFLYLALTAPHKPTWPGAEARGRTRLGEYGDLVAEVDAGVGRVLAALEESGMAQQTLFLFTSDNGSYMRRLAPGAPDHVDDGTQQGFRADRHRSNGPWRGTKADIWEGGHRVPLIVRWPGEVAPGTRSADAVCLTDLYATLAEVLGMELEHEEAEDSLSLLSGWRGARDFERPALVQHSVNGTFALRSGRWKLVLSSGSGGREAPAGKPFEQPWRLFDLEQDPGEASDLAPENAERVARLAAIFEGLRSSGRTRESE